MLSGILIWSHALAALLFGVLAAWTIRRDGADDDGLPRALLAGALGTTALWLLAAAGIGTARPVTQLFEGARTIVWLLLLVAVQRRARIGRATGLVAMLAHASVVAVVVVQMLLSVVAAATGNAAAAAAMADAAALLRVLTAVGALVLLQASLPFAASASARIVLIAVGGLWLIDANLAIAALVLGTPWVELSAARGVAVAGLAVMIALALSRRGDPGLQLSRTATFHSLSLLGLVAYFSITIMATSLIEALGGSHARIAQTAFVFGSTAAALTMASSDWLRAWIKVKLAKHLFRHRYDYRAEWTRFTETLGEPKGGAPLDERLIKAVADLTDAPAGLLLVADDDGLAVQASWRWDGAPVDADGTALAAYLARTGRIVELDRIRHGDGDEDRSDGGVASDAEAVPLAMLAHDDAWVIVPLPHRERLTGAILLARPVLPRALDWEDFDLLRIAGRQVASYLAEARAQDALAEARRFEEFNRRFAFILHDVKNIVSQLSLVARNAQRHADNPEFRADMVMTLNESATRLTDLLARLSVREPQRGEPLRAVAMAGVAAQSAARFRASHGVELAGDPGIHAVADPVRLQQVVDHLVHNAIEAGGTAPVRIVTGGDGDSAWVEVIDAGAGMTQQFVRDELFRPFVSSKPTGFGIGAFEARQLAQAMGGRIEVDSRVGHGTRFRVTLSAAPVPMEHAA